MDFSLFRAFLLLILSISCSISAYEADFDQNKYKVKMEEAHRRLTAGLYASAIPFYQEVLHAIQNNEVFDASIQEADVRYQLAQAYFFSDNYAEAAKLLQDIKLPNPHTTYLLSRIYNKMGKYEETINLLGSSTQLANEAEFELGYAYFHTHSYNLSRDHFVQLFTQASNPPLRYLAGIYLIKIDLIEKKYSDAESLLNKMIDASPEGIRYEFDYLAGETAFHLNNFAKAIAYFTTALPKHNPSHAPWYADTLYYLGWSHLKMAENETRNDEARLRYFNQTEEIFNQLFLHSQDERTVLALGRYYLSRAHLLHEPNAYLQAEKILSRNDLLTREGQVQALLLRAEGAPTYAARNALYKNLTQELHQETPFYPTGWYHLGLNDYEEAKILLAQGDNSAADSAFEKSTLAFKQAFILFKEQGDMFHAALALKYQAQATFQRKGKSNVQDALSILSSHFLQNDSLLKEMSHPDEIYYMYALYLTDLAEINNDPHQLQQATDVLKKGLQQFPKGKHTDEMRLLLGTLAYKRQNFKEAETIFQQLVTENPNSPFAGEALFWSARTADELKDSAKSQLYRQQVFEKYPESPYAAEAYFTLYTYYEYLQGNRAAIKHLQEFEKRFPDSPYNLNALYLIGLDYQRDRKTPEGKWLRKKNLTAAIQAFQELETAFDRLYQPLDAGVYERKILKNLDYYISLRYRAVLERALTNMAIADESQGAKRQIFSEYAQDVFSQLVAEFNNPAHPFHLNFTRILANSLILEESSYGWAQACIKANCDDKALKIFEEMLEKYHSAKITRGYYLSLAYFEKGLILMRRNNFQEALKNLKLSEDSAKGKVITTDQKLELWIQQSLCYSALKDFDNAILVLSHVINDNAISVLRVKAMYLRAEAYQAEGRHELARRQFEATTKKGSEWALKAQEKLDKDFYGH